MNLMKRNTWLAPRSLQDEINNLFMQCCPTESDYPNATSQWSPKVDIQETEKNILIHADIPGVDPTQVKLSLEDGILTIQGERSSESKTEEKGFTRIERSSGSFYRRFSLPEHVDAEGISAKGKHGVLEIVIPKSTKQRGRSIPVEG